MILTGKVIEDFSEHLYNKYGVLYNLEDYHETMLNAEIIDFFDSVGIYIEVGVSQITGRNTNKTNCNFDVAIFHPHHRTEEGRTLTQLGINVSRQEAKEKAIIRASYIYNERDII